MSRENIEYDMTKTEIGERIQRLEETILQASNMLLQEDYKVIKCSEANLRGEQMPYDVEELLSRRDKLRASINQAQDEISVLQQTESEDVEQLDLQINDEIL